MIQVTTRPRSRSNDGDSAGRLPVDRCLGCDFGDLAHNWSTIHRQREREVPRGGSGRNQDTFQARYPSHGTLGSPEMEEFNMKVDLLVQTLPLQKLASCTGKFQSVYEAGRRLP